ncbi:hypothetical protein E2C01_091731 [Portunus trituberculatus]|uniref:Uncharacterized protein n=1 Tax=Portunus trituberculatus TaxID=210409 RepID=A0A5B7JIA9_PORTR|nr:hypothetical protein [Portunus trituberculatus]
MPIRQYNEHLKGVLGHPLAATPVSERIGRTLSVVNLINLQLRRPTTAQHRRLGGASANSLTSVSRLRGRSTLGYELLAVQISFAEPRDHIGRETPKETRGKKSCQDLIIISHFT